MWLFAGWFISVNVAIQSSRKYWEEPGMYCNRKHSPTVAKFKPVSESTAVVQYRSHHLSPSISVFKIVYTALVL